MSRRRRRARPADPMALARARAVERAARADPAAWGFDRGALALAANADVEVAADLAGRILRARRRDVFELLAGRGGLSPAALTAARRLQDDLAWFHRVPGGVAAYAPRIDRTLVNTDLAEARLRAGARVASVLASTGAASAALLRALMEPGALSWRDIVEREAGERLPDAQAAAIRAACGNLAAAYAELDRGGRRPSAPGAAIEAQINRLS